MQVKNEFQANNKKVSWRLEVQKRIRQTKEKDEREQEREREREVQSDLLRISYISWAVCALLFLQVLN